ncbi:MAG: hypothetical protein KAT39_06385 [Alphaproteobacteria bacterium]|nr:hypothetical protein [Alphaproteobacteria bacterium]
MPLIDLPGFDILTFYHAIAAASILALAACTGTEDKKGPAQPLPERVVLQYDFSGDWMATAGDQCTERLDLSDTVFLSIGASQEGDSDRYHIADFFILEPGKPAEALVGTVDGNGWLGLAVETEGMVDGRRAEIIYALLLEQEGALVIRLRAFTMTVRDPRGGATETDLLAEAAADPSIPILGATGNSGLCLKRLPR